MKISLSTGNSSKRMREVADRLFLKGYRKALMPSPTYLFN